MGHIFLTGATGLLGNYLVRDLLEAGAEVAVLVRAARNERPQERVEKCLTHWESQTGRALRRPVVVEGDLAEPELGLDSYTHKWIGRNCDSVLHNAASLAFHSSGPSGEPWRSNLHGTERVLQLCRRAGIRNYHHVSTAYVCGQRSGRILESELNVGQTHGNDYEISKFRAEVMVRNADFLDAPTIYRPGIIVGDSQTGYTSTFHGFYVPLKLISALLGKAAGIASSHEELIAVCEYGGRRLTEILNLSDRERKNYVPVDWISNVMARIILNPLHHGRTYHLTPTEPVSLRMTREVMERAFFEYAEIAEEKTHREAEWSVFENYFFEAMKTYESYWRDDPVFDTSNTTIVAPDLPCPEMDAAFFMRLCRFAIETNFGRRSKRAAVKSPLEVDEQMQGCETITSGSIGSPGAASVDLQID